LSRHTPTLLLLAPCLLLACKPAGPVTAPPAPTSAAAPAFSPEPVRPKRATKNELIVHMEAEPPHLNPLLRPNPWSGRVAMMNIYEPLLYEDPYTYELKPALAERWELSKDGLSLTFHLRKGVKWHDGEPFTAKDVAFTLDKIFDPAADTATYRGDFEPFLDEKKRYEATDEGTVVLYLNKKKKSAFLLASLAAVPILPGHVFAAGELNAHPANSAPVGTGPYVFKRWRRGKGILLRRSPSYWGAPAGPEQITFFLLPAPDTALAAASRGFLDLLGRLPPHQLAALPPEVQESFDRGSYYPARYSFLLFNTARPVFQEKEVRKAIAMLVDRETIQREIEKDRVRLIESPYLFGSKSYNTALKPLPFDPAGAAQLLEKAGWKDLDGDGVREKKGVRLAFSFALTAGSPRLERQVVLIQKELQRAGIQMELEEVAWSALSEKIERHDFELTAFLRSHTTTRIDSFGGFHSSQVGPGGQNYGSYSNPEVDKLLEQIRAEPDEEKRVRLEWRLQEILHEELPQIFLFNEQVDYLVRKGFVNTTPSPIGWFQLRSFQLDKGTSAAN
jgi:peptide/nickel transport system substrate-binding protein